VRLDALGRAPRAELLHVLMLPEFDRADRIGEFWSYPQSRAFAERLIDCEEDRTLRPVLVVSYEKGTELPDNGCIASPSIQSIQSASRRRSRRGRGLATEPT
jgi:hypothetical protein